VRRPYPGITGYDGQEPKPPASFLTGGFFPEMIFPETMHRTSRILALTALLFAAGAALFFIKAAALPYKVAYPVLLLAVAVFCLRRKALLPVGAALLLSALGDAAGAKGLFIPQMLFFALAHGAYIRYFLCAGGLPARPAAWLLPAALLALLFAGVVPRVLDPAERIGVAVYGAVIAGMLYTVLRYRGAYAAWFRFAALLFVFSDGVIAWSRFIGAVPGRTYVVMVPYYLAQCLFFCFAVKSLPARPSEGRSV
jgi:transmembrane protein 86B